ncbi:MAG: RluA family pseudouridine synthase [Candidatus Eisenbacteria bacterium]
MTPPTRPTRRHQVLPEEQGERLDRVLARAWPELTRSRIQALLKSGHVRVEGRPARASEPARPGAVAEVTVPASEPSVLMPEAIALSVVYEDEVLLVIDKPAGMVVHPGAGVRTGTLVHALLAHCPGIEGIGGVSRPGLVHRLDKDTSGLLVVAKTDLAYQRLTRDLARRAVARRYLALVWGVPGKVGAIGRVEAAIGRDPKHRQRMAVRPAGASGSRAAATRWRVLAALPAEAARPRFALVCCELETGRTHQIRVHMGHAGFPVVGDATYGGGVKKALSLPPGDRRLAQQVVTDLGRQALHAAELEFQHPIKGGALRFEAPLPHDLVRALSTLGLSFRPSCS